MPSGWLEWFCTVNRLPLLLPRNFCSSQVDQFTSPWMCCKHSHHRENLLLLLMFSHPTVSLCFFQVRPSSEIPLLSLKTFSQCQPWGLSLPWVPAILAKPSHFGISSLCPVCLSSVCVCHLFIYAGDGVPGRRKSSPCLMPLRNVTSLWALHPECGQGRELTGDSLVDP